MCFAPQLIRAYRRANNPAATWVPTGRDVISNIVKDKFKPGEYGDTECTICMVDYEPNDEITPLPCDGRHFFHTTCIENWLKNNNSCPLCKKPITM